MAHISLPDGVPGIRGLMAAYPETQVHLSGLAEVLLRGPSSLSPGERETIAAYVPRGNECRYCCETHAAAARRFTLPCWPDTAAVVAGAARPISLAGPGYFSAGFDTASAARRQRSLSASRRLRSDGASGAVLCPRAIASARAV